MADVDPSDRLEAMLRQSCGAISNAGFSARVESCVRAHRRRVQIAQALPAIMAAVGILLAAVSLLQSGSNFADDLRDASSWLASLGGSFAPVSEFLARYSLQPWIVAGALTLIAAIIIGGSDDEAEATWF
jgi:hypothetical protein